MTVKNIPMATSSDVQVCNLLVSPVSGCHAGGGLHIVIPSDFAAQVIAGNDVPGCTYVKLEADGSLNVDARTQALAATPAVVQERASRRAGGQVTRAALSLGLGSICLVLGCTSGQPNPCTPQVLAGIEATYSAQVLASCQGKTMDTCDAVPALKADRAKAEKKASCR